MYGPTKVLKVKNNVSMPDVSFGKVLIDVRAAGVNPVDYKIRDGDLKKNAPIEFPAVLGGDFSGVIKKIGDGVSGFEVGDEVYGQAGVLTGGTGTFAEVVSADAKNIALKPATVDFIEAAVLPLAGVSALEALIDHMNLATGQKILIHGGAGGIGSFAIQIAKDLGAYVSTTVNAKDIKFARELGADKVIDYEKEKFEEILKEYDAVFDTVGGESYKKSFQILKEGGIIVSMIEKPDSDLKEKYGVDVVAQFTEVNTNRLTRLSEIVDSGKIEIFVDKIFPLDESAEALDYQETKHPQGKVVIQII